jgi:hypothetical protein
MYRSISRALLPFLMACSIAQASCDDVYRDNVRNRDFSEKNWSSLNTLYDQLCTSSGEKRNSSWNASLDVIVEDIPIGMTGGGKDASEKTSNFCHYYNSYRYDASHKEIKTDDVVVDALNNYNVCKNIELARVL